MRTIASCLMAIGIIIHSAAASVAADPAILCQSGKLGVSARYGACRLKAEAKAARAGESPEFTNCETSFNTKFLATETKAGEDVCPTEGDDATIKEIIDDFTDVIDQLLAGDRFDASGDTIIDNQTGLEWEKKNASDGVADLANAHDVDNIYTWCAGPGPCANPNNPFDGTAATEFLARLNGNDTGVCYAGHCDWRLPSLTEAYTIVPSCLGLVDPVFAPNAALSGGPGTWSAITVDETPASAWNVCAGSGGSYPISKASNLHVRAVRSVP